MVVEYVFDCEERVKRKREEKRMTHIHYGITQVPLLTKEDVGCPGNKAPHRHI